MVKKTIICFLIIISSFAVQSQDKALKLWYQQPAAAWIDALPVGNGRMGAMVFGNIQNERIQLNEESIWAGKKLALIIPDHPVI